MSRGVYKEHETQNCLDRWSQVIHHYSALLHGNARVG
jgi:hypothetical protein